jgi:hypothetical protein
MLSLKEAFAVLTFEMLATFCEVCYALRCHALIKGSDIHC